MVEERVSKLLEKMQKGWVESEGRSVKTLKNQLTALMRYTCPNTATPTITVKPKYSKKPFPRILKAQCCGDYNCTAFAYQDKIQLVSTGQHIPSGPAPLTAQAPPLQGPAGAQAIVSSAELAEAEKSVKEMGEVEEGDRKLSPGEDQNLDERHSAPRRYGAAIRLKPGMYRRYRELHDAVWPQVLDRMTKSNIRNFVIYYHAETSTLFQHFEWLGHWKKSHNWRTLSAEDERRLFEQDMQAIASDPVTQRWWQECEPCQEPFSQWPEGSRLLSEGGSGPWWAPLECVAHCGHWPVAYTAQQRDPDFQTMARRPA